MTATLTSVIHALCGSLSGWALRGLLALAVLVPLFNRLALIGRQIEGMRARLAAGTLRRVVRRAVPAKSGCDAPARTRPAGVFPRGTGWLVRAAAWRAAVYGAQLKMVLETPEMVELLMAAPQAARVLRPMCRMLMVDTRLLRPGVTAPGRPKSLPHPRTARVRRSRIPLEIGRIALPRGVMASVRRGGFEKTPGD